MYYLLNQKKTDLLSQVGLCWRYGSSRLGQCIVLPYKNSPVGCFRQKKNRPTFVSRFVLALPIFPVSSKYCASFKSMPVACFRRKKLHPFGWCSLCWRYLSSRPVTRQVLSAKVCLTSVFGMGTGGPTPQSTPTSSERTLYLSLRPYVQSSLTPSFLLSKSKQALILFQSTIYPEN